MTDLQIEQARAFARRASYGFAINPTGGESFRGIPQIAIQLGLVKLITKASTSGHSKQCYMGAK